MKKGVCIKNRGVDNNCCCCFFRVGLKPRQDNSANLHLSIRVEENLDDLASKRCDNWGTTKEGGAPSSRCHWLAIRESHRGSDDAMVAEVLLEEWWRTRNKKKRRNIGKWGTCKKKETKHNNKWKKNVIKSATKEIAQNEAASWKKERRHKKAWIREDKKGRGKEEREQPSVG